MDSRNMPSLSVEEFSSWFRDQEAATRLDILVAALQMLHPLEIRFIASCVEELTRRDYYCFRECEIRYNGGDVVAGDFADLTDIRCRGKLLVALSLLYSGNYSTACILFKALLSLYSVFDKLPKTKEVMDEVLLLLNMAKHHPAFKFEQGATIAELAESISHHWKQRSRRGNVPDSSDQQTPSSGGDGRVLVTANQCQDNSSDGPFSTDSGGQSKGDGSTKGLVDCGSQVEDEFVSLPAKPISPTCAAEESAINKAIETDQSCLTCFAGRINASPPAVEHAAIVDEIAVTGIKKMGSRNCIYELKVLWSKGDETTVEKSFKDWHDFHKELLNSCPLDAGAVISGRKLPYFPGFLGGMREKREEALLAQLDTYLRQLKLLPEVFQSAYVLNFLKCSSTSSAALSNGWSAEVEFTNPNDLSLTSDNDLVDYSGMNGYDKEESRSPLQHPDFCNGIEKLEVSECDVPATEEQFQASTSTTPQRDLQKGRFVFPCSKDIDRSFVPSTSVRGSYGGIHQGLATTLLIVRPSSASPSLGKILQSNLLSRDSPPKVLAAGTSVGKVEPSALDARASSASVQ